MIDIYENAAHCPGNGEPCSLASVSIHPSGEVSFALRGGSAALAMYGDGRSLFRENGGASRLVVSSLTSTSGALGGDLAVTTVSGDDARAVADHLGFELGEQQGDAYLLRDLCIRSRFRGYPRSFYADAPKLLEVYGRFLIAEMPLEADPAGAAADLLARLGISPSADGVNLLLDAAHRRPDGAFLLARAEALPFKQALFLAEMVGNPARSIELLSLFSSVGVGDVVACLIDLLGEKEVWDALSMLDDEQLRALQLPPSPFFPGEKLRASVSHALGSGYGAKGILTRDVSQLVLLGSGVLPGRTERCSGFGHMSHLLDAEQESLRFRLVRSLDELINTAVEAHCAGIPFDPGEDIDEFLRGNDGFLVVSIGSIVAALVKISAPVVDLCVCWAYSSGGEPLSCREPLGGSIAAWARDRGISTQIWEMRSVLE